MSDFFVICYLLVTVQKQSFRGVMKNGVLKNFVKFTGKHLCRSRSTDTYNFNKRRFRHSCFPVTFVKFLRTLYFKEHLRWMLLNVGVFCYQIILIQ